jgi:D-inositol-3-phosphate glycosyltransferase
MRSEMMPVMQSATENEVTIENESHRGAFSVSEDCAAPEKQYAGSKELKLGESDSPTATIEVALLTGGQDPHYASGLATALAIQGVTLDVIGSDAVDGPEMHATPGLRFFNLHGNKNQTGIGAKIKRVVRLYVRLMRYAATAQPRIFHVLWNNQIEVFDRTLLLAYYKALGKKIVLTAHNVNAGRRDAKDSWLNRFSLRVQYRLADHIFVHTAKMKAELINQFQVKEAAVSVIPYGINNAVPDTELSLAEARRRLGIGPEEKTILFFGSIKNYKGLEYLVPAFQKIAANGNGHRLIIAGERKKGSEEYFDKIQQIIARGSCRERILQKIEFIPDDETELYFKAADVAVLPYSEIFQSGILFLAYRFGLPVIASDVGSFRDDVIEGKTGFICKPCDSDDLAAVLEKYFASDLFRNLSWRRAEIREYAHSSHSWETVGTLTQNVYRAQPCKGLLGAGVSGTDVTGKA